MDLSDMEPSRFVYVLRSDVDPAHTFAELWGMADEDACQKADEADRDVHPKSTTE